MTAESWERVELSDASRAELLLMTPGPTRVPAAVLAAGARPMMHHRTPAFSALLATMLRRSRALFGTGGDVLPVHSTGRGAMVAAIANLFAPGDEIVCCCNGKFGHMWAGFAETYGLIVHRVSTESGGDVDAAEVDAALAACAHARAVTLTHCDTTSGVLNDVETIAGVARSHAALTLVDGISSIGGVPFELDRWGVDLAITASQKCLMSSPGLALVALNENAWAATERAALPRSYWNFGEIREFLAKDETPGTTPVHSVQQVSEALALMDREGLDNVYARHANMADRLRQGIAELGLELQCPELAALSPTLTAIAAPAGVDAESIRAAMRERGILIAIGLLEYRGRGFRIAHMGDIRPHDIEVTLGALAEVLADLRRGVVR